MKEEKDREYREYLKKIREQKYAFEKIEKDYDEKVRLPEIKREEMIRNDIRSLHRPIRKDELDDHERAYQEAK